MTAHRTQASCLLLKEYFLWETALKAMLKVLVLGSGDPRVSFLESVKLEVLVLFATPNPTPCPRFLCVALAVLELAL